MRFNLFKKQVRPKVYAFVFKHDKGGAEYIRMACGYSMEEAALNAKENIADIEKIPVNEIRRRDFFASVDIENIANEYSESNQALKQISE